MQIILGIAAICVIARFLVVRDRRVARQDYAPYYRWLRGGK